MPCDPALPALTLPQASGDPVQLAAGIVAALAEDGWQLDRSNEHYTRVVERVLRDAGSLAANGSADERPASFGG